MFSHPALARATADDRLSRAEIRRAAAQARRDAKAARRHPAQHRPPVLAQPVPSAEHGAL
jgi:hypothetical protein